MLWITMTLTMFSRRIKQICNFVAMSVLKTCYWATENPCDIHQKPLHSEKVIVWCGVASFGVIGSYFFENEAGRAITVNSARCTEMLHTFLEPKLQRLGVEKPRLSVFSKTGQNRIE